MKLFKNYKSKQQLREEIAELKGMLYSQRPQIHTVEREVHKLSSDMIFDNNLSIEYIKEQIALDMVEFLKPFIEWDVEDDKSNPFKKRIRGNIYLAKKKGKVNFMKNIEIITCNSMYKDGECIGGYHEIHKVNYLQNTQHLIATINSIIKNNLLYGCEDTVLEEICVSCEEQKMEEKINKHYNGFYGKVRVQTRII